MTIRIQTFKCWPIPVNGTCGLTFYSENFSQFTSSIKNILNQIADVPSLKRSETRRIALIFLMSRYLSEIYSPTNLDAPRAVELTVDHAEAGRVLQIQIRVGEDDVIEEIGGILQMQR